MDVSIAYMIEIYVFTKTNGDVFYRSVFYDHLCDCNQWVSYRYCDSKFNIVLADFLDNGETVSKVFICLTVHMAMGLQHQPYYKLYHV